jgi:predicted nucleotidyltransferase
LRISDYEKEIIVKTAKDIFGNNTKVYLFGSRVYDDKKGGDIDLYIIPENKDKLFVYRLYLFGKIPICLNL